MTIEFKNGVPTFFEQGPTICLRDPLAAFLGAAAVSYTHLTLPTTERV